MDGNAPIAAGPFWLWEQNSKHNKGISPKDTYILIIKIRTNENSITNALYDCVHSSREL